MILRTVDRVKFWSTLGAQSQQTSISIICFAPNIKVRLHVHNFKLFLKIVLVIFIVFLYYFWLFSNKKKVFFLHIGFQETVILIKCETFFVRTSNTGLIMFKF